MERGRRKLVRKRYTPDSEDEDVLSVDSQDSGPAIRENKRSKSERIAVKKKAKVVIEESEEEFSSSNREESDEEPAAKINALSKFAFKNSSGKDKVETKKSSLASVSLKREVRPKAAPRVAQAQKKKLVKKKRKDLSESDVSDEDEESEFSSQTSFEEDDENDGAESDSEDAVSRGDTEDNDGRVQTILARKGSGSSENFLVKWKGMPYSECAWIDLDELLRYRSKTYVDAFRSKEKLKLNRDPDYQNGIYFDPEFLIPDRILTRSVEQGTTLYLVKWRNLKYSEATWHEESEIPSAEEYINAYEQSLLPHKHKNKLRSSFQKFEECPAFKNQHQLRSYQLEGMNWLCFNWHLKRGSILADEMGLGKTIQAISLLHYLQEFQMIDGPFIVIAPLSTIRNWHREIQKWTNMRSVMYHGDSEDREIMRNYEMMQPDNTRSRGQLRIDVIVTNYESVITDAFFFRKIHWKCLVIDEAHRLKNKNSSLYREIESWKFDYPLMLTGTPIQNNVEELFALLHFIDPSRFANFDVLKEKLGEMKTAEELGILHSIMKPYLLRRVKADVEKSLAPKEETLIEVVLTNLQKKYYRAVYEKILGQLIADKKTNATALRNVCMQLRKVCNHPFLLDGVEELEVGHSHSEEETILKLIRASGKTIFLDKLLTKLYAENHRVLIFSQFKTVLDLLEDYVNFKNYKYERLDGGISGNERQDAIDRYSAADSDKFIFLLTTRAGGVGINLTAADTVIIFDSDWNPQQDIQAQARCHRIGQTKTVKIYRLITKDSYEMEMFKKSSMKLGLDKALLSGLEGSKNSKDSGPSNEELESLLKFGAYHVFKDDSEENDESAVFAEDIEHILSKAKTVQLVGNEEDGAFARVSFLSSTQDADVHVNDPDFWNKLGVKYLKKHNEFLDRRDRRTKMRRNSDDASKKDSDDDAFGSGKESSEYEISSSSSDEDDELGDGGVEQVSNSRWKRADWELFCSKLMDFGITNMKRCQINHEDDGNSDAELEMNAWMVIFCCYKYGNLPSNQRKLLLLLQEKLPHIVPESLRAERYWLGASSQDFVITVSTIPVDSILRKSKMVEYFTSNGKSLIDRIFSLYCLNLFFNAKELGVGAYNVAVPSGDKSLPSEKWLESEDIQLMQSIMENGYGEWNEDNFQNKFGGFLIRNNNEWPKKSVIEKRAKFLLRCVVRIVNLTFSYQMRVAPPPVPVKPVQPKPAQQQAKPVIPTMPAPRTQVIHSIRLWHIEDVARLVHYLKSWPVLSRIATKNDYMRMSQLTQINLDLDSLKRLHAAIMKAYYKVADLKGEFPVVLQDHITNASVQITLNSRDCQMIVAKAELFANISQALNLPNLNQLLMTQFPVFPGSENLPAWWNNELDLVLLRAIYTHGFIDWRKARQDPANRVPLGQVIDCNIPDTFIITRLHHVCSYLLAPIPGTTKPEPDSEPAVPRPAAIKPAPIRPVPIPREEGDIPQRVIARKVPLKQANVTSYFPPTQPK